MAVEVILLFSFWTAIALFGVKFCVKTLHILLFCPRIKTLLKLETVIFHTLFKTATSTALYEHFFKMKVT